LFATKAQRIKAAQKKRKGNLIFFFSFFINNPFVQLRGFVPLWQFLKNIFYGYYRKRTTEKDIGN
jgi:hypothetical protein